MAKQLTQTNLTSSGGGGGVRNYDIDYTDERFGIVEADEKAALENLDSTYDPIIEGSDKFYNDKIEAAEKWGEDQTAIQNEKTEFAIDQINQQKDQAQKDYTKEQSGAYADWQLQSAQHGVNAEKRAASGLTNTGYSESSQVAMYNQYQNRVTVARDAFARAVLAYDNSIKEAMLQNNEVLAQIAAETLEKTTTLALEGFQYKNSLVLEKANKELEVKNIYYQQWKDVLDQMNTENDLAEKAYQFDATLSEEQRQFEIEMAEKTRQFDLQYNEDVRQFNKEYDLGVKKFNESIRQFNAELERLKKKDSQEAKQQAAELELKKKTLAQEQKQWEAEMQLKKQQLAEEKRQFNASLKAARSSSSGGSSGNRKSSGSGGSTPVISGNKYEVSTPYYKGAKNADCAKFGTFSNGYQPKGISGHGKLSNSGDTITFATQTLDGHKMNVTQTIWKAADGTKWYWEGRQNKYIKISSGAGGGGRSFGGKSASR